MINLIIEFKRIREKKGITLEEISNKTKINIKYLLKIEKGELEFLSPHYVKGFIKSYLKCIGISLDKAEEIYKELIETDKNVSITEEKDKSNKITTASDSTKQIKQKEIRKKIYIYSFFVILVGIIVFIGSLTKPEKREAKSLNEETFKDLKKIEPEFKPDKIIKTPEIKKSFEIEIFAKEMTWFSINIDGDNEREFTLRKGNKLNFKANESITMRIGKSQGVILFLDGKEQGILGPPDTLVWELIITQEGIKSKRLRKRSDIDMNAESSPDTT